MRWPAQWLFLVCFLSGSAASAGETEIAADGPFGPLAGTLNEASSPSAPVALILPGSGPTDRDGNNPAGIAATPYRLLAQALAPLGVSSVRVDKRGMFGSAAAVPDANAVTIGDYAADVAAWVAAVRARTGTDCVWLIGHSEGGLVALEAARSVENLCGLVLIAAPGRRLSDVLRAQLAGNPQNAPFMAAFLEAVDTLEQGDTVDVSSAAPVVAQLFAPQVQPYLRDLFAHDPAAMIAVVDLPILIVHGGHDLQVLDVDADLLQAARPTARRVDFADMNHVLKAVPGDLAANLASYADPALPLAPGLAEAIADFMSSAN